MGIGSSVMKRITEAADKAGATLSLSPSTDFGASSVSRLKSFYAGFGFVANKGRAADLSIGGSMIRTPKKSEIAFSRATVIASPDAEFKPALTLGQGLPPEVMGQPAAYFWKEALVPGNYQDRAGTKFTIDAKRVDNLIANFNKAKANGFTPRVPDGHTSSAKTNMGFILEARKNSRGGLELLHQMVGDDAIKAVARNKTSICTVANAIDEHGNEYDELIDHNAIVPDPQLNNLRDFVPALAASRAATESAIVLTPAADTERSPEMDLIKLREAIGAAKEVTDEQVISQAVAKLGESTTQLQLSRSAVDTTKTDLTTAITRAEQAEAKVLELSRMNSAPDLDVLNDRAALKSERIDLALERGQCTKAQADLLKASLKDGDKPAVLMLSKSGTHGTPVDLMLKVLELNKPFVGLSLSRAQQLPDPNNPSPAMTEARKKELLAHAGV